MSVDQQKLPEDTRAATQPKKRVAVVGGGIAGLMSALEATKQGHQVVVYEGSNRLGGLIETDGNSGYNKGAEFIDSDSALLPLCEELGVKYIKAEDQEKAVYLLANGKELSSEEFLTKLQPLVAYIQADKAAIAADPQGKRAQEIDSLSTQEYLQQLAARAEREGPQLPFWKRATKFIFGWKGPSEIDPEILDMAAQTRTSEGGRDNISAMNFVSEASSDMNPKTGALMASDCAYRIEGGTEALIKKLEERLAASGVDFQYGAKAKSVQKNGEKLTLDFQESPEGSKEFDHVVFAVNSTAMAKIEGLKEFGLSPEDQKSLAGLQHTLSTKGFVPIRPEAMKKLKSECVFLANGSQAWIPQKGVMEFLMGGERLHKLGNEAMMMACMENVAKKYGMKVDEMFDVKQSKTFFCRGYASPKSGQMVPLLAASQSFDRLAMNGVGVAGGFVPQRTGGNISVGFMDNGVRSAQHTMHRLEHIGRGHAQEVAHNLPAHTNFLHRDRAREQSAHKGGGMAI